MPPILCHEASDRTDREARHAPARRVGADASMTGVYRHDVLGVEKTPKRSKFWAQSGGTSRCHPRSRRPWEVGPRPRPRFCQDVCLVLPGALEPFDAPLCIQAEWERQPPSLTQRRYGSYSILKATFAMLLETFF